MSVKYIQKVWDTSPYKAEKLLVLLALADWSNDDGYCWPSIDKIARKARITERGAFKIMAEFKEDKTILLIEQGGGRSKNNIYRLNPENWSAQEINPESETLNENANPEPYSVNTEINPEPENTKTLNETAHASINKNRHDNRHVESTQTRSRKKSTTPVPDTFIVTEDLTSWANEKGICADLQTETDNFLDYHKARDSRFVDWTAAWRTWMRNTKKYNSVNGTNGTRQGGYEHPNAYKPGKMVY